jgi:FkbM family methyltransferase
VIDVGAHLGLFSILMARLVGPTGRVFSFEPTPFTRSVLAQVIRLNCCVNVVSVCGQAVSGMTGESTFYDIGTPVSCQNSLVYPEDNGQGLGIPIPTIRLDDFVFGQGLQPRCLKIDVEGAELDVLKGAANTFREYGCATHLALHPQAIRRYGHSLAGIWELLQTYGMVVSHRNELVKKEWFCRQCGLFDVQLFPGTMPL